jgi:hypothetical protein
MVIRRAAALASLGFMLFPLAKAQTYGTRNADESRAAARGTNSTAAPCAGCGWVESVAWIEKLDPGLLAAAGASGQGVPAMALALTQNQADTVGSHYEIRIRMDDGSLRLLRQDAPLPLGMAVHWANGRVSPRASAEKGAASR